MQMLYNSDSYAVVLFDVPAVEEAAPTHAHPPMGQGGYELVDKFARREIFLQGAMAESFKEGVAALIEAGPTEEAMDDYIERYASLMQQSLILH